MPTQLSTSPAPLAARRRVTPRATWGATFLCWLKQDAGLGRVLLHRMGLETVVRINSPVQVAGPSGPR